MERKNLLRIAVETRRRHLIRLLMMESSYEDKEAYLSSLTLSELEDEWRHLNRQKEDHIG